MRILYLCADRGVPLDGHKGASAHVRGLIGAFRSLGHEVRVAASVVQNDYLGVPVLSIAPPELDAAIPTNGRPRVISALRHVWNNVAVESTLSGALVGFGPDLIYERYSPFGVAGGLLARRRGIPHILEVNAPLAWEGSQYRRQALQEAAETLEEIAFASTGQIVAVSAELREVLVAGGVPARKIAVVPNGVDTDLFTPAGPTHRAASDDRIVIGFVGSLKPWHGIDVLVRAFRELAPDPRYRLLIVGDGPEAKAVRELSADLPGRVELTGAVRQDEVPAYLRSMDLAIAPYPALACFYYSPLKVLEYLATGGAVVASRVGQLTELIRDGETGILVPPGDAAALAAAIRAVGPDRHFRAQLGIRAAAEVRRHHTWRQRAAEILHLARSLT